MSWMSWNWTMWFVRRVTHNDAAHSVGLLWTSDQLVAETSTWQHTTLTTDKYPCPPVGFKPMISAGERPQAARLLKPWVRIPPGAWKFVWCECRVLSGRGLCDELITRSQESYRLWCVVVCDLETSRIGAPYIYIYIYICIYIYIYIYDISSLRVNQLLYCVSLKIYNKFTYYFCELKFSGNTHQRT
jgi:hypothetical protein